MRCELKSVKLRSKGPFTRPAKALCGLGAQCSRLSAVSLPDFSFLFSLKITSPYTCLQKEGSWGDWKQKSQLSLSDLDEWDKALKTREAILGHEAEATPPAQQRGSRCCTSVARTGNPAHPGWWRVHRQPKPQLQRVSCWANPVLNGLAEEPGYPLTALKAPAWSCTAQSYTCGAGHGDRVPMSELLGFISAGCTAMSLACLVLNM